MYDEKENSKSCESLWEKKYHRCNLCGFISGILQRQIEIHHEKEEEIKKSFAWKSLIKLTIYEKQRGNLYKICAIY